jgi:putative flippase GtrA
MDARGEERNMRPAGDTAGLHGANALAGAQLPAALADALLVRAPFLRPHWPMLMKVARFLCVGLVGLAIDSSVFALFFHNGAGAPLARAVSLAVATVATWLLNRTFTFGASGRPPVVEMLRYFGVAAVAQGFNYVVFLALHYATHEAHPFACLFTAAVLTTFFSFTGQSVFAFARAHAEEPVHEA